MIRKSKNNNDMSDFEKMWGEVEEDIQVKDAEQDIISRVPELKRLNDDIEQATNTCVNATLQCESVIQQYQRAEEKNWVIPLIPSAARLTPSTSILTKSWKMHPQS